MSDLKKQYHHGDLGQSLLEAATDILRKEGVESLSMRKLADKVGVSRTAPYHHFKDKNVLLCAIAEQGFLLQETIINKLFEDNQQTHLTILFERYVMAYIQFAEQHSETYDLMYGRDIWKSGHATDSLKAISKRSFQRWVTWVERLQNEGVLTQRGSPLRVGQTTWATLHGLCRLLIDGIYLDRQDLEEMARHAILLLTLPKSTS